MEKSLGEKNTLVEIDKGSMVTITISGTPGSGKTTVGKLLAKRLGLRYIYSGLLFRKSAEAQGMTLEEFGEYAETHPEVDQQLDAHQLAVLQQGNVIVEGRIAGWIAYRNNIIATKILLDADLATRAGRIVQREKGTIDTRKIQILAREKSEGTRYKLYYNIDLEDTSIYDLIIDTSKKTPEQIVDLILSTLKG